MEFLKQWCLCICITLVVAAVFSLFAPKGRMNRFYGILISFFIFVSFIVPFKDFRMSDLKKSDFGITQSAANDNTKTYEKALSFQIKQMLKDNGIKGASVSCSMSVSEDLQELTVREVKIAIPDEYDKEETEKLVFENLGISARVVFVGE